MALQICRRKELFEEKIIIRHQNEITINLPPFPDHQHRNTLFHSHNNCIRHEQEAVQNDQWLFSSHLSKVVNNTVSKIGKIFIVIVLFVFFHLLFIDQSLIRFVTFYPRKKHT